jgi:uncharacterized protein VirK/YbjX
MYSLIFSFFREEDSIGVFIGGIQGRDTEGVLDKYRELTKACHGMRPRDLLIEIFRMLCSELKVVHILAVSDEYRHSRSKYFGDGKLKFSSVNYNEIWLDRGGTLVDPAFYSIDVETKHRDLEDIPAKKRGMYRRRYDMLETLREQLRANYRQAGARADGCLSG